MHLVKEYSTVQSVSFEIALYTKEGLIVRHTQEKTPLWCKKTKDKIISKQVACEGS